MSQPITITLSRAELRALLSYVSKDLARVNLNSAWLVPDGRAFACDGHRLVMVCPDGQGATEAVSPRQQGSTSACVPVSGEAIAAMLKGSRKGDQFEITASREADTSVSIRDRHGVHRSRMELQKGSNVTPPPAWNVVPSDAFTADDEPGAGAFNPACLAETFKAIADLKAELGGEAGSDSTTIKLRNPLDPAIVTWTDGARAWTFVLMPMKADVRGSQFARGGAVAA